MTGEQNRPSYRSYKQAEPDPTTARIDYRLSYFDARLRRDGFTAAKAEVIAQLAASAIWLERECGSRQAYELVQELADELIASQLPQQTP